jgi:SNF family Na+-dependent transporter
MALRVCAWPFNYFTPKELSQMDNTTTRNKTQARKIESWILNQIAMRGSTNVAKALGMDKSGITRWKESMLPKLSMLLAVLEWGVVDDDMARLAKEVASILKNEKTPSCGNSLDA